MQRAQRHGWPESGGRSDETAGTGVELIKLAQMKAEFGFDVLEAAHGGRNRFAPANSILLEDADMDKGSDSRLDQGWWFLRIGLGAAPFLGRPRHIFHLFRMVGSYRH
jgi:hypothetical protein